MTQIFPSKARTLWPILLGHLADPRLFHSAASPFWGSYRYTTLDVFAGSIWLPPMSQILSSKYTPGLLPNPGGTEPPSGFVPDATRLHPASGFSVRNNNVRPFSSDP